MTLITQTADLAAFCQRQSGAEFVAVDTEFMRDKTYWPQLCLVQVAGPEEAAAIDSLAPDIDLKPLYDLLTDTKIVKVFHAARQDMEVFFHLTNKLPVPIVDTQVAAMVCGLATLSAMRRSPPSWPARGSTNPRASPMGAAAAVGAATRPSLSDVTHLRLA
jgi:ribonuclease D